MKDQAAMTINLRVPDLTELKPRITVFGVGGAGGNAVNNMIACGLRGVEFVVANTDAQALLSASCERRIQMGTNVTEGLGAGSKPEVGAAAAEEAMADIKAHLVGCHMVFITAGMGGGTGTGAAPVIARASREEGILTVGVVTKPFQFEGQRRLRASEAGIAELQKYVDTLLVIPNQNLFRVANEKTTFADAFAMADDVLRAGVSCITDLMVKEGLINLDFADVRTIMAGMGKAMMGTGEASGDRRAILAAEAAISNPLLDDVSMKGASGLLVSITGGNDLTLYEVDEAASRIRAEADGEANIIVGATFDDELDGTIRVSVVATGIGLTPAEMAQPGPAQAAQMMPQERGRLTERLAGLAAMPGTGIDPNEPSLVLGPAEMVQEQPSVWRAPGNVTIEKRAPQTTSLALPLNQQKQAPQQQRSFQPGPPTSIKRAVRRMPSVEELPLVAQNEIKAKSGHAPQAGLSEHKRKVGFLERLANVGRARPKHEDPEPAGQREPGFGRREPDFAMPQPVPEIPRPAQGQRNVRIERPRAEQPIPSLPKRVETQSRLQMQDIDDGPAESLGDDDLEIPAFLRRRAN
jgi:cell division protein FtsZ